MIRKTFTAVLLIALASVPMCAHGQEGKKPCKAEENETPSAAFLRCSQPVAKAAMEEDTQKAMAVASTKVLAQASSAVAADASGSRVSDSLTDLLPLLQGAVTPANTGGDGVPVVLNFNSPPFLRGKTSLQATLTEPELFAPLGKKFTEADRDAETKGLLDRAGGFGDTTYSLGWSPVRRAGNWSTRRQLFGREPKIYLPLVEEYANDVLLPEYTTKVAELLEIAKVKLDAPAQELARQLGVEQDTVFNELTFSQLREKARTKKDFQKTNELIDQMEKAVEELSVLENDAQDTLAERENLADRFAVLIGNQPELQVRASYRDADTAVGPRDFAVSVVYSAGTLNFNRLLDDYQGLVEQRPDTSDEISGEERRERKKKAFEDLTDRAIQGDLWRTSYAITYKKIYDYDEAFEDTLDDGVQKPSVHLEVPGVEEWKLRLNYSQLAGPAMFAEEVRPRIEFSVEGTWVQEDADIPKAMRRQDRIVGRITYTVPTTENLTFPVSIVFANHPEFLTEDKDLRNRLSAHVGLSYKLPRPNAAVKAPE